MQAEYPDGLFGPVKEFNDNELKKLLDDGAKKVTVFKSDSTEHNNAKKRYSEMTRNQKKRFRKNRRK